MDETKNRAERRTALLTIINESPGLTRQEICERVHYYGKFHNDAQMQFHRDIESLREDGYPIVIGAGNRYRLEQNTNIDVSLSRLDASLLASVLASTSSSGPVAEATHRGISKILASTEASRGAEKYLTAKIPDGDAAMKLADAIQRDNRVRFLYNGHSGSTEYMFEPAYLTVHYGHFYVSGYASKNGKEWLNRTFRVSRILLHSIKVEPVAGTNRKPNAMLQGTAEFERPEPDSSFFTVHDVELAVRGKAARVAAMRGEIISEGEWNRIVIDGTDRQSLYEFLSVYGADARIVRGPIDEWKKRVSHVVAALAGEK